MKTKVLLIALFFGSYLISAQKLTPDVDLVSELVSQKQEEIKQRVLKNIIVKNIKTTNYTTYNTMYRLVDILTTEKNKTVMSKSLIKEVGNYAVNYVLANHFLRKDEPTQASISLLELSTTQELNNKANVVSQMIVKDFTDEIELKDKQQIQKYTGKQEALIANFVIDSLYDKLVNASIPYLTNIGLFKSSDEKYRFRSVRNFEIDYTEIEQSIRTQINLDLDKFITKLTTLSSIVELFEDLDIESDGFDLSDLKNISKDDVELLFSLFEFSLSKFEEEIGKNSFLAKIGKIISKYVIYEARDDDPNLVFKHFKIDVEAIILGLEDQFYKNKITTLKKSFIGVEPFFLIGLNYGVFPDDSRTIANNDNSEMISDLAFVSEKFGLKFKVFDWGYKRSHQPMEWYQFRGNYVRYLEPQSEPLIKDLYAVVYGSGILYNVVDLKSQDNFNFGILGLGTGITFFNDMELNVSYSIPFIDKSLSSENAFLSLGFDIPIFEYLKALGNKNK